MTATTGAVYLRRRGSPDPIPAGWDTALAGSLAGVELEVVFDPARHDICRALLPFNLKTAASIGTAGYKRTASLDDGIELWVRDRAAAIRATLANCST